MSAKSFSSVVRFPVMMITGLSGILFLHSLGSPACGADHDEKDAVIKQQKDIAQLQETVKKLEEQLKQAETARKEMIITLVDISARMKALEQQNERLMEALREALQKKRPFGAGPQGLNPPNVMMQGSVTRVDKADNTLVEISLGRDHGLFVNQTLEAYRLNPEPKYLGPIRIVETSEHKSIARLIKMPLPGKGSLLKVGDKVTSSFAKEAAKK